MLISRVGLQVLFFRTCEVVARVSSLALFNRACRPYGAVIEVSIEGLIWAIAVYRYGGRPFYACTSVFSYMNPILERGDAPSEGALLARHPSNF